MPHRSIEEVIDTIAPSRRRGIPNPSTIEVGVSGSGNDLSTSLSQAGQQIAQLQSAYRQQANLIAQNTQAIQSNTSAQSGHSIGSTIGHVASSFLGGAFGFLSPIISGIASLFGGGRSTPAPLPIYTPPSPVSINAVVSAPPAATPPASPATGTASSSNTQAQSAPHITVNINAMDSQSFMDRSNDIASAVRAAMLNMHPINDVVANL
ncbi:MAG: hypothetical protein KGN84_10660 [Acidobacteriota bacterium]|nr:hypothetical protein [Acidobacteriota bacterium]